MTAGRWEVVALWSMSDQAWIVPMSEGRHYRRTWLAARWTAWRWTRHSRHSRLERDSLPPFRWKVRRAAEATVWIDVAGCLWCTWPATGKATRCDAHGFHRVPSCGAPGHGEGYIEDEDVL